MSGRKFSFHESHSCKGKRIGRISINKAYGVNTGILTTTYNISTFVNFCEIHEISHNFFP